MAITFTFKIKNKNNINANKNNINANKLYIKLYNKGVWKRFDNSNYSVNNFGDVRNDKTKRIVKGYITKYGYKAVYLSINGKIKGFLVHRLVAILFVHNPNICIYNIVNHKNENKLDNSDNNLEWCTQNYNHNYGKALLKQAINHSKPLVLTKGKEKIIALNNPVLAEYFNTSNTGFTYYVKTNKLYRGYKVEYANENDKNLLGNNTIIKINV